MKATIPEKIFLSYETDEDGYTYLDYMWHRHRFEGMENIEYTRTDVFIEKAENFLEMLGYGFTITDNITHANYDKEQFIEDFRKYMEE